MKTGRNAPCPCGSGKKYKKCCRPAPVPVAQDRMLQRMLELERELEEDEAFYGYAQREASGKWSADALDDRGLVCMAYEITHAKVNDTAPVQGTAVAPGQWILVSGACESSVAHGPFEDAEAAFEFGRVTFGAEHFTSEPETMPAAR